LRRTAAESHVLGVSLGGVRPSPPPRRGAEPAESELPRPEYPRPQLQRERWINLNGPWRFAFDDLDAGRAEGWQRTSAAELERGGGRLSATIVVPFCPQSRLSGIGDTSFHDVVWYGRTFATPPHAPDERVVLHFGAVDYLTEAWVNGRFVARHEGGHTPFSADVTGDLSETTNTLLVRAEDPGSDPAIPRGKQDWKEQPSHIFYSRTTGIWQTVWLEVVDKLHVDDLRLTPNVDAAELGVEVHLRGWQAGTTLRLRAEIDGLLAGATTVTADGPDSSITLTLGETPLELWSQRNPVLYDLTLEVIGPDGRRRDVVTSYFGMRTIEVVGDQLCLNGEPLFLRLVLDQGYWPEGVLTAPTDAAFRRDIELAIAMGFNGARKHQKIEDPRWLYWADRLGFLVWGEMANAHRLSPRSITRTIQEWADTIARDFSHPCLIAWIPINESNGCRLLGDDQRTWVGPFAAHFATAMYHLTKTLDPTRPALSNDGWEHTRSDLCTLHDYRDAEALARRISSLENLLQPPPRLPPLYAEGYGYSGEPVIVTEYGGIFQAVAADGFDYAVANDNEDLVRQLASLTAALLASPIVSGFCYTQLADVEHEQNGLLTADRQPKVALECVNAIITAPSIRENGQRTDAY
jgi:beta-galactosidase/beta-glucuronidase